MSSSKLISPSPFSSMASTSIAASSGGTSMTSTSSVTLTEPLQSVSTSLNACSSPAFVHITSSSSSLRYALTSSFLRPRLTALVASGSTSAIAPIASQSLAWLSGSVRSIEWSDGPVLTSELREESYSKLSLLIHEKTSKVTRAIVSQSHASEQPGQKAGQVSAATSLEMGHADASPQ